MARDWSEAEIGQAKRSPYHEPTQTNTPQTATAPTSAKDKHGTRDSQSRHTRLAGRGGKSPKPPLEKRNAPRQRRQGERGRAIVGKTRRALQRQRQRRRAEGQRQFSRQVGTFLAQAPRRGFGGCKAVGKRERRPKTPRPMGQRPSRDEYGDDSRTKPHRARGYNLLALGGAKPRPRREWDNPLASQPDPNARHNKTPLLHTAYDDRG